MIMNTTMIKLKQQQQTNQWVLTSVQFNLVFYAKLDKNAIDVALFATFSNATLYGHMSG